MVHIHISGFPNYAHCVNNLPSQYSHLIRNLLPTLLHSHLRLGEDLVLYVGDETYPFINIIHEMCPFILCSMTKNSNSTPLAIHDNKQLLHSFRTYMMNKYVHETETETENHVIFIKRGFCKNSTTDAHKHGSSRRNIRNEQECLDMIGTWCNEKNYSFNAVDLENMKISEQMKIFCNATLVIAQHGAGLMNVLWCLKEPLVIELYSPPHRNWFSIIDTFSSKWLQIDHDEDFITVDINNLEKCINNNYIERTKFIS
jgi:capsular polysaccharide biosynthesis protein